MKRWLITKFISKTEQIFDEEAIKYQICRQNKVFLLRLLKNTAKNVENRSRRRKEKNDDNNIVVIACDGAQNDNNNGANDG